MLNVVQSNGCDFILKIGTTEGTSAQARYQGTREKPAWSSHKDRFGLNAKHQDFRHQERGNQTQPPGEAERASREAAKRGEFRSEGVAAGDPEAPPRSPTAGQVDGRESKSKS